MLSVYFFSYFQRVAIPGTIFNDLQKDLGLSASAVAAMGSMFTWIYGGMQIVVGILADRFGGARTLLAGGLMMLAGSMAFPLLHSTPLLVAARALTGLGASFMYLSIVKELDRLFGHSHFTLWLGIMLAAGYCGGMLGTLPFEQAAAAFGWRPSLLAVAGMMCAAWLFAWFVLRRLGGEAHLERPISLAPLADVLRNRRCIPLLAGSFIFFPLFFVIQAVLGKKFLQDFGGLSSAAASGFIMAMTAVSAACVAVGGYLPRHFKNRRKPCFVGGAAMLLLAVILLLAGTMASAPRHVFLCAYILMAISSGGITSGTAIIKELNHPESVAASISLQNAAAYIGCGCIGQAGGAILDIYKGTAVENAGRIIYPHSAYVALFIFLLLMALVNLIFTILVSETHGRNIYHEANAEDEDIFSEVA